MTNSDKNKALPKIVSNKNLSLMREVPMNISVEQALLGAILSNNQAFEKIEEFLEANFFSSKIHQVVFKSIKKLITNDQVADLNTVKVDLGGDEDFINNGGITNLLKLCENTISIINSKQYGELIHDLFLRRKLIDVGTNLINDSYITNEENKSSKLSVFC